MGYTAKECAIYLRVDPRIKRTLQKLAVEDGRTVTSLTLKIVTDWLRAKAALTEKRARIS